MEPTVDLPTAGIRPTAARTYAPERILAAAGLGDATEALRIAHARAAGGGGRLAVCRVLTDAPDDPEAAARWIADAEDRLAAQLEQVLGAAAASAAERFVLLGDPAQQIRTCAEAWDADLVVIGHPENPSGILSRLFRPGIVDRVVRYAPCAVLVTRPAPGTGRIVIGTDFSDPSLPVLRAAAAEQRRTGAAVQVVYCIPPASLYPIGDPAAAVPVMSPIDWNELYAAMRQRIEAAIREVGLVAEPRVVHRAAADGLIEIARGERADLLIIGTHGRGGLARLALGSVAQQVVNEAPCPVLVVRLAE